MPGGTDLCAPSDPSFQAWLATVYQRRIVTCASGGGALAYLTQAVQSRDHPVPLFADEAALLRVFPTTTHPTTAGIPPGRVRFYLNGTESHLMEIPAKPAPIPTEVEVVIEIDPDGTLDPSLGVGRRIPETGRMAVEVRETPVFDSRWFHSSGAPTRKGKLWKRPRPWRQTRVDTNCSGIRVRCSRSVISK